MRIGKLIAKFQRVKREYGVVTAIKRVFHYIGRNSSRRARKADLKNVRATKGDVLFVNGCAVEHPTRYRVLHQMEQLQLAGLTTAKIYFEDLELGMEPDYRVFIFYRCEITDEVESFIKVAKKKGKTVYFDVDDLVIDTKYTDEVPFIQALPSEERRLFGENVRKIGKTLALCDVATTTTEALAEELGKVVVQTYVNRNTASQEMVACAEAAYQDKMVNQLDDDCIRLGYFSGSLTHNEDFEIVHEALVRIMEKYQRVELILVGELNETDKLQKYSDRIVKKKTVDWRQLPWLIAEADINLAPLTDTLFNRCKSEIKWIEAALVRVPTAASRVGAFEVMIKDGKTGILCDNTVESWYNNLEALILDKSYRDLIGQESYHEVLGNCITSSRSEQYANMLMESR